MKHCNFKFCPDCGQQLEPDILPDNKECPSTTHYAGCACHERGWQNKWELAVEMAAQAQAECDQLKEELRLVRRLADSESTIKALKCALADAIRRPMGVIPASAEGLITDDEIRKAEEHRMVFRPTGERILSHNAPAMPTASERRPLT